ncbi:FAD:protein FMN transferase [Clostridium muellerianum]|nr:FAD:protein FMN transferase [Clostridium muellerianum]
MFNSKNLLSIFSKNIKKDEMLAWREFYSLGTIIQLRAYGNKSEIAISEAMKRVNDIDDKMSAFKDYSELSKINRSAGKCYEKVSCDTYFVINKAVEYSRMCHGTFDPTIRPIVNLWNIGKENFKIPDKSEIANNLNLVDYKDICLDEKDVSIKLKKENQKLDVGGIAKGYAADEVKRVLEKYHIKSALIDLGGNILAVGNKVDGSKWNVGIQNPLKERGEFVGVLSVSNKSVVTSGNYERYSIKNGKRFHHIIDSRTGYPSEGEVISTTIISDYSIDGDGLSTGVYIMGVKDGMGLIESINGVEAIFITEDKKVYTSSGIKDKFNITNIEFSYGK